MPPMLQSLDQRQKLTLVGGVVAFRRVQLFGHACHQFDTPIRIRLGQRGSNRKIACVEVSDVFLRRVGKNQDRGTLELKFHPGN